MMAVCVNLAQASGLRSSVRCLRIVLVWLGMAARLPDWTTVRTWLMRAGVAALEEPVEVADDWVWLADHSNQIGPEKVLVILGVRSSKLPPPGVALTHADMRVLAVEPGVSWKREDMSRVYATLAARSGAPQALVVDGAVELREGAEVLRTLRPDVVILSDFKHQAANVLKKIVGGSETFTRFTTQVGRTRSAIQQTELAHLTPPGSRPKARFMNLAPTLTWARMALWQLDHPESQARATITTDRMHEKLGWLADFSDDIPRWNACQEVVNTALSFINPHGLSHGTAERLADLLTPLTSDPLSGSVAQRLIDFVRHSAAQLPPASPAPLTPPLTENPLAPHHSAAPAPLRLPPQHRNPRVRFRPLQTTRTTTQPQRIHQPPRRLRGPAQTRHTHLHPPSLLPSLRQTPPRLGQTTPQNHRRLTPPNRLPRIPTPRLAFTMPITTEASFHQARLRVWDRAWVPGSRQRMPGPFRRWPMTRLQADSITPEPMGQPFLTYLG